MKTPQFQDSGFRLVASGLAPGTYDVVLADGVDIRTIQLMLSHADIKQTQRYLNITDEERRKVWERRRQLRAVGQ